MVIIKQAIILTILLLFIAGCTTTTTPTEPTSKISGTQDLVLTAQDLQQLGMTADLNNQDLSQLGILDNGTNCHTEQGYSNVVDSSLGQYTICAYLIPALNDTQVIIELQSFADYPALNGSYQYDSSHLFSVEGLISQDTFGDQSKFRVNNENDYGGQFNTPGIYYYHLWFTKDLYLVHITSKGTSEDAKDYIANTGEIILKKFG